MSLLYEWPASLSGMSRGMRSQNWLRHELSARVAGTARHGWPAMDWLAMDWLAMDWLAVEPPRFWPRGVRMGGGDRLPVPRAHRIGGRKAQNVRLMAQM